MNYELAKQLKDAGFKHQHDADFCVQNGCFFNEDYIENPNIIHLPTLSELIEACGENLQEIRFLHDQNRVIAYSATSIGIDRDGITPEEAVAKLWLALNEK